MEWEKQKFLIELEIEKVKIEIESLSKWIWFLQACFLLTLSATVGAFYKNHYEIDFWTTIAFFLALILLIDLLWNFRKLSKLKDRVNAIGLEE